MLSNFELLPVYCSRRSKILQRFRSPGVLHRSVANGVLSNFQFCPAYCSRTSKNLEKFRSPGVLHTTEIHAETLNTFFTTVGTNTVDLRNDQTRDADLSHISSELTNVNRLSLRKTNPI